MADPTRQERTFQIILASFLETGRAPELEALAEELGVSVDEARAAQRKLVSPMGFPGWLKKGTDTIGTFPPFSNVPTPHRINVDGKDGWYGQ